MLRGVICIKKTLFESHIHNQLIRYNSRGADSNIWLQRQMTDPYIKRARIDSYRCRSAYKLVEIDSSHNLISLPTDKGRRNFHALDLGASPGSWTQVIMRKLKQLDQSAGGDCDLQSAGSADRHLVVSLDLQDLGSVKGAYCLPYVDIRDVKRTVSLVHACHSEHYLGVESVPCEFDLIVSDMAPNATGHKEIDMFAIVDLAQAALKISLHLLRDNGTFLCKLWSGREQHEFETLLKKFFQTVHLVKPPSSRGDSAEIFYLARGFNLSQ